MFRVILQHRNLLTAANDAKKSTRFAIKMLDSIKIGNRVLAAGIYGTVKKVNEKTIDLEVAKGVVIEVAKNAVASVE